MSTFIHSNANRCYAALENKFGEMAVITPANRVPALRVHAHQSFEPLHRKDKTGARTLLASASSLRVSTNFGIEGYLVSQNNLAELTYCALLQAACGAAPILSEALSVQTAQGRQVQTATAHNLVTGAAVAYEGEVRFVTTIIDQQRFLMNAPFSALPAIGASLQRAVTYRLGTRLPSISIYDYWDPITAVSRIISGAVVDTMAVSMQDGYHQFTFGGPAADLVDSANIGGAASAEIRSFPIEPAVATLNYSLVPGNSGELWIGTPAVQFLTVTHASVVLKNNVEFRNREFGSGIPRAFTCGRREILMRVSLLASDDAQTVMLYAAAKQRAALPMMLQLGSRPGQVMAIYLPKIIPDIPVYDDAQPRLAWDFLNNLGLGIANDELYVAFA